jgi:hypothetical protein
MVSRAMMLRLQEAGQFNRPDDHVRNYRASLEADFQNKWEELRKRKAGRQGKLIRRDDQSGVP